MRYLEGNLWLGFGELTQLGVPYKTIDKGVTDFRAKKSQSWVCCKDPVDSRKSLVLYTSIPPRTRAKLPPVEELIKEQSQTAQQAKEQQKGLIKALSQSEAHPLLNLVESDLQAQAYYLEYVLPTGKKLAEKEVDKLARSAAWLNLINRLNADKKVLKSLHIKPENLYQVAAEVIKAQGVELPCHERRLKQKALAYQTQGYEALIAVSRYGNANSKKVRSEEAEALLLELIGHFHKHDDTIVAAKYNEVAKIKGWLEITPSAVGYWRRNNEHLLTMQREGASKNYNKFSPQILRLRPSAPMLLVNSDDNILNLYFQENREGKSNYKYWRPALYLVMDAFNDYILGWAIGDTITTDLIRMAYQNANQHIYDLTKGYYLPHQLVSDRFGVGKKGGIRDFYESIGIYTPATAKVAQGKYIERAFGVEWEQNLKAFPNYGGSNITSKERLNPDALAQAVKNAPAKEQAHKWVSGFIEKMRQSINKKTGKPRQSEWVDAFFASEKSRARAINSMQMLTIFGVKHSKPVTITSAGLKVSLLGEKHSYLVPEAHYLHNVGREMEVIYNPYDINQIMVSDGKGERFVIEQTRRMPAALADYQEGDRAYFNSLLGWKKRVGQYIGDKHTERLELNERTGINAESLLQAGVLIKEERHLAEAVVQNRRLQPKKEFSYTDLM